MTKLIDFVFNSFNMLEDNINWLIGRNWAVIRFSSLLDQKFSKLQRFRHLDDALFWIDKNICSGQNKEKEIKMLSDAIANKEKIEEKGYYETKTFIIVHRKWLNPNKNTSSISELVEDFKRWLTGNLWVIIHLNKINRVNTTLKRVHTLNDALDWIDKNFRKDNVGQVSMDLSNAIKNKDEIEQRRYYKSKSFTIIKVSLLRELK